MCGIAGLMTVDGGPAAHPILDRLAQALAHRGPDGRGTYRSGNVGMVHTRLAIIDLKTGDQPLHEPGGGTLVGNGEIYNYLELRDELPTVVFSTESDCEVSLHLFRRHGLDFTRYLRGMYALAIHDSASGHLILARDPFGIKPLYYVETSRYFAFASEPSALIKAGLIGTEIVRQARNELLQLQFTSGRDTIYQGIRRVLPGETLVVAEGRVVERRRLDPLPVGGPVDIPVDEAVPVLDSLLRDSVLLHQRSDVPYGMFLSGGIDSTAILAMMTELNDRPVTTFTIGFAHTRASDERPAARVIAQALGAEHVELEFGEADFWNLLPEVAAVMDDPAADYAILPTFLLARAAKAHGLKVILSGEGGDELFAGYGRYRSVMRPWWAGGRLIRSRGNFDDFNILRDDLTGWRDGILAAEVKAGDSDRSRLQIAQAIDCSDWLPNDLLTKLDRCLMAHGIEGRTPFLDHWVGDFAFRLPDNLKVRDGLGKWLLRRWLNAKVPAAEALARKKGFTVPVGDWLRHRAATLAPLLARQASIREICRPDAIEKLFAGIDGKREAFAAWTLLFYALWHRAHIAKEAPEGDVFQTLSA